MRADRPKWPYLYSRSHVRFVRDARNGLRMRIMIRQWMLPRNGGPFAGAGPLSSAVAAPQAPFWNVIPRFRRSSPFKHLDQKHLVCQKHHAFLTFRTAPRHCHPKCTPEIQWPFLIVTRPVKSSGILVGRAVRRTRTRFQCWTYLCRS